MPKLIPAELWDQYFALRDTMSSNEAAQRVGINKTTAWRLENVPNYNSSGRKRFEAWRATSPAAIANNKRLNTQAKRALNDFAYFRMRYFGRKSTPWQVYAANLIRDAHEEAQKTMDRKFIVINCPPGSGKSTLFSHDIPLWLLCRDRATRILIGSATETLARGYTEQMMTTLERQEAPPLEEHQRRRGAVQAAACLVDDFGRFKPDNGRNWRTGAFKIAQPNDQAATTKEASVSAFGRDSSYLGQRPDVAVWDDLVTEETSGTTDARERTLRKWQREAEQRVEPGGVLILQGQRLFADDLYRYCIDLPADDADEAEGDNAADGAGRKYVHVMFKAHYEEHCRGDHTKEAQPYNPADPENGGCLLDPIGLSWKFLRQIQRDDETHGTSTYQIVFQQEDGDPSNSLVNPLWVEGGVDVKTGEMFQGCWDHDRVSGRVPRLPGGMTASVVSIDSSPTKYWALQWWTYHAPSQARYLIDMHRAKMKVTDAISYDKLTGEWTGVLERWWHDARAQGSPISHIIFELGSAERYFLQQNDFQDWARMRGVIAIGHDTKRNKRDPQYGVQMLGPIYRNGQVRLPGETASGSRARMLPLVSEVTHWPDNTTTDCLMAEWFFEHNLPKFALGGKPLPRQPRPSWANAFTDGRSLRLVGAR